MRPTSPQPTASRWFTLLLTVLLVTSLAAPFMAGPAVAEEDDDWYNDNPEQICTTDVRYVLPISCAEWIDPAVDVSTDETIMHSTARAEAEGMDAHYVGLDNHLQDTNTIASLEARHAIATAWEDGKSESEAYQDAMQAIRDYYAVHQINHLEQKSKKSVQLSNVAHAAEEDEEIHDRWITTTVPDDGTGLGERAHVHKNLTTTRTELVNGEMHEYQTGKIHVRIESSTHGYDDYRIPLNIVHPEGGVSEGNRIWVDRDSNETTTIRENWGGNEPNWGGRLVIPNVGDIEDGGLPSETVFDAWEWYDRWTAIEHQSDQAVANYDVEFVSALYAEMDAGNLDPEEVRGAEGMARYLSGDSNVTDQRFQLALMQMSGMSNPDLAGASSMTVEYEGYTDIRFNGTGSGERVPELSDHTEGTFEGLLFASEVPAGGFETNQTYATGDVNVTGTDLEPVDGSVQVFDVTEGETTHFYEGTFTVTEMYDTDGNEVESVEWEQPEYDTYNASEFAAYIEEVQDLRDAIEEQAGDDDGISIGIPDLGDVETGEALVGLVIIVIVAMAIIGLVTDLLPWF